jgi:hypothetical protein
MFEPFLTWLYTQKIDDLDALPAVVNIEDCEKAMAGYRRSGLDFKEVFSPRLVKALAKVDIYNIRALCALTEKAFKAIMGDRKQLIEEVKSVFKKEGYEFVGYRPRK